ncbi:hypothetical protein CC86DRAFT_402405 [Ophiobolus disseminans]|uniref:RelA/SpoT domain-containing protein n=1 Tax=Ophiobolus disseminans TaxID=1469910 RepID=A0A6A7AAN2_9PLEO|nr:hypothetical protein CC86DRAFT_402405 [Ophiobolus disseminans]
MSDQLNPGQTDVIEAFRAEYEHDLEKWQSYMNYTLAYLKKFVKKEKVASLITGRVKEPAKVEKKLRKKQPFYKYGCGKDILNNLVDFVGLRISAYFPNDQRKILQLIDDHFITIASVYFENDEELYILRENVSDEAGQEILVYIKERHEEAMARLPQRSGSSSKNSSTQQLLEDAAGRDIIAYIKQRHEEASVSQNSSVAGKVPDETAEKDILLFINQRYEEAVRARFPVKTPKPSQKALDNYQRRFGGYTAEHRWVILRPAQRDAAGPFHLQPIEIQVRSVLMDSWIAINRDIEYDALTGVLSTQERRILDSIKGLAQTGEVLLEQLHQANSQRLSRDQRAITDSEDITRALIDYFELEASMAGFSKDPFSKLFLEFLLTVGIRTVGDLRAYLKNSNIPLECREEIAEFMANFPMKVYMESFFLWKLLQTIRIDQIKKLWGASDLCEVPRSAFDIFVRRTLHWVAKIMLRRGEGFRFSEPDLLPFSCGIENLTLIFCIFIWIVDDSAAFIVGTYGSPFQMIATLLSFEQGMSPFLIIALVQSLIGQSGPSRGLDFSGTSHQLITSWVPSQLTTHPFAWEQGVTLFLQYVTDVKLKALERGGSDGSSATSLEEFGDKISRSTFAWMVNWCTSYDLTRISYARPNATANFSGSKSFWDLLSEYTMLHGLGTLIDDKGNDFRPWQELRRHSTVEPSWDPINLWTDWGPTQGAFVFEDLEKWVFLRPGVASKGITKERNASTNVIVLVLDCSDLSDDDIQADIGHVNADVIFLKTVSKSRLISVLLLRNYYMGELEIGDSGLYLITLVRKAKFAPASDSESLGALGPLWKIVSQEENVYTLVCDLLVENGPDRPPARLRLPNCRLDTKLDAKFLPAEAFWSIKRFEGDVEVDENLSPLALISGDQTKHEASDKPHIQVLSFRSKLAEHYR